MEKHKLPFNRKRGEWAWGSKRDTTKIYYCINFFHLYEILGFSIKNDNNSRNI